MRILITNDDGINGPGLEVLMAIAKKVSGKNGEVWTVAPATEQSGVGHCISYNQPSLITELGPQKFAVQGSPADCVLAGLCYVLKDNPPDLILSGVNKGNNSAENTVYSGTVGAAMEGALQNIPSIALSQFYGPKNANLENPFEASLTHADNVIKNLFEKGHWNGNGYKTFYNVNFPPVPSDDVKGISVVAQGLRGDNARFKLEPVVAPNGRTFLWIKGGPQDIPTEEGTDVHANLNGFISITPMRCDLTAHDLIENLKMSI